MSKNKETWNTKENAEAYDIYARSFSMYQDTSKDLVDISNIQSGMTVVDLAAGTGATTQAIINKAGDSVSVIAIDQAEEMLKKAKEKFSERGVKFIVSEAEDLDKFIHKAVDMVICNSAFWQMKAQDVFKSVSNVLKKDGIFAFNLPDSFFSHKDFKKQPIKPLPYNLDDLILWGKELGLILVAQSIKTYIRSADEKLAFSEIPVMNRNFKTEDEKNEFIAKLKEESVQNTFSQTQWIYLVFKKT